MKTFVVHYHKLTDRKKRMNEQLISLDIEPEFIEQYDRDTLTREDHALFHNRYENMLNSIKAITLSHIYCYREICEKYEHALILEDDAILCENFKYKLDSYISQLPVDWDMLFIGDGCGFHIPSEITTKSSSNIFKKCHDPTAWGGNGATRCVDSYIVNKKCAHQIINYMDQSEKIGKGIDWWLNKVIRDINLCIYWAEPTLVTQGSQNSLYGQSWI
jgi:GR25 family glycosyltransferase involved in LPS biosynthesis